MRKGRLEVISIYSPERQGGKSRIPLGKQLFCSRPLEKNGKDVLVHIFSIHKYALLRFQKKVVTRRMGAGRITFHVENHKLYADLIFGKIIFYKPEPTPPPQISNAGGLHTNWRGRSRRGWVHNISGGLPSLGKGSK